MNADDKIGTGTLLAIAVASFVLGFWIRRKEQAARTWSKASGRIVSCELLRQPGPRGGEVVTPVIEYEFNHEGRSFKSSHWRFGNFSVGNSVSAQAVVSRYPVGSSVTVFVNPQQPMKSVLEHQPSWLSWVPFGFGIFFLAVFLLAFVMITMKLQR
ncbi:MAG: DUF3592 domain-containing protein [Verrucomicrobiota bacterium]